MAQLNPQELSNAAHSGEGYQHLTPAQTWNAHFYSFTPEQLTDPLPASLIIAFGLAEQEQRSAIELTELSAMLITAFDETCPPYIRLPVVNELRREVTSYILRVAPPGIGFEAYQSLALADVARVLGITEGELLAIAEQTGTADRLHDAIGTTP